MKTITIYVIFHFCLFLFPCVCTFSLSICCTVASQLNQSVLSLVSFLSNTTSDPVQHTAPAITFFKMARNKSSRSPKQQYLLIDLKHPHVLSSYVASLVFLLLVDTSCPNKIEFDLWILVPIALSFQLKDQR